jgi:hypothetical protein
MTEATQAAVQKDLQGDAKAKAAGRIARYQTQKAGHDHEWVLLSGRVTAYLTSQSLLATGAALLASTDKDGNHALGLVFMSMTGMALSIIASLVIAINCSVINSWHYQIQRLIKADEADNFLGGFYMPRSQPDWFHTISTDGFSIGVTVIGVIAWAVLFWTNNGWGGVGRAALIATLVLWAFGLLFCYRRFVKVFTGKTLVSHKSFEAL